MQLPSLQADFEALLLEETASSDYLESTENMLIYRNNHLSTLRRALENTYPMLVKLLGDDFFHSVANDYLLQFPSRQPDLNEYGEYFSHFLASYPPVKQLVYLTEVARFEWACHQVFYAADHPPLAVASLQMISPADYDNLRLSLHPASRLMRCQYPILQLIDLCKEKMDDIVDIDMGGVDLLIIRRELDVKLVTLTTAEFAFLSAVQEEQTLSHALETTLQYDKHFDLNKKLPQWVKDKTIVKIELL